MTNTVRLNRTVRSIAWELMVGVLRENARLVPADFGHCEAKGIHSVKEKGIERLVIGAKDLR